MDETIEQQQRRMAGYMTAIGHLLTGDARRAAEFRDKIELIVAGAGVDAVTIMQWGERTRRTGAPILLFSPLDDTDVPQITLVAHVDGRTHLIENCMLWLGRDDRRARLVPDNFRMGAFVLGDRLQMRYLERAPARDFDAALPGTKRAYDRLLKLEMQHRRSGEEHELPTLHQRRLAA